MSGHGQVRIGTSGWHYDHWIGRFYPDDAASGDLLGLYADRFDTVEINNTFYQLPEPETFSTWRRTVPPGFVFACKASRYISHMKKLKDPEDSTRRFLSAIDRLGPTMGPILFQLPPRWKVNVERLRAFVAGLPKDHRCAFEFRDESWFTSEVYDVLVKRGCALCAYEISGYRSPVEITANFAYVRLHGPENEPYRGEYDGRTLAGWARRFRNWLDEGIDVYCYFDNDENAYACSDALSLKEKIEAG